METGRQTSEVLPLGESSVCSPQENDTPLTPTLPVSPPYWHVDDVEQQQDISASLRASLTSGARRGIVLEDHTEVDSAQSRACWARSARIDDYVIIGSKKGVGALGAYVVFNCAIETTNGSMITIRKRYSEFDTLRIHLVESFPNAQGALPRLPPKSVLTKFDTKFLEKRRIGLQYFLNCVILNPEFSASPILKDFLFA